MAKIVLKKEPDIRYCFYKNPFYEDLFLKIWARPLSKRFKRFYTRMKHIRELRAEGHAYLQKTIILNLNVKYYWFYIGKSGRLIPFKIIHPCMLIKIHYCFLIFMSFNAYVTLFVWCLYVFLYMNPLLTCLLYTRCSVIVSFCKNHL